MSRELAEFLSLFCGGPGRGAHRTFFGALLWMARTGAAWRDLPEQLGKWKVVHQRYACWCGKGHVERFFQGVQQPDLKEVMVDSSCCRAYPSAPVLGALLAERYNMHSW